MDLTEAEHIKKRRQRWQEYTEELYKKDLHNPDNHDGMIIQLEPDILENEVKWTLGSIPYRQEQFPAEPGNSFPIPLHLAPRMKSIYQARSRCYAS